MWPRKQASARQDDLDPQQRKALPLKDGMSLSFRTKTCFSVNTVSAFGAICDMARKIAYFKGKSKIFFPFLLRCPLA